MKQLLILCFIAFLASCNDKCNCSKHHICAKWYQPININVVNSKNQEVLLDEWYTIQVLNNSKIRERKRTSNEDSSTNYELVQIQDFKNQSPCIEDIRFVGLKNNTEIFSKTYTVKHDQCNVYILKGDSTIVITE